MANVIHGEMRSSNQKLQISHLLWGWVTMFNTSMSNVVVLNENNAIIDTRAVDLSKSRR